ncbi:MAG: S41 family peptidase [Thermomicrobiales bacterium]
MNADRTTNRPLTRTLGACAALLLSLLLGLGACTIPGNLQPTATPAATATTAAFAPLPTPTATQAATAPTSATTAAAATTAVTTPATPTATTARVTATAAPTATATAGRATPVTRGTPGTPVPFNATAEQPCRDTDFNNKPLPQKDATVTTVEQAYRCLLLHYVDHKTLDNRTLLNGSWDTIKQAGQGLFSDSDMAPLALTGDVDADWQVYANRYNALVKKYGRTINTSALARVAIDGLARSLNDNHVAYLDPDQWQRFFLDEQGNNTEIGPGFDLALDDPSGKFYLYAVYPDTPAGRGGLKAGDIIEQVNGTTAAKGVGNQGLYDLLVGPVGTKATVRVNRPATGQTITAQVSVVEYTAPLIESRVLDGGIGYIKLRNYSNNAGEEFDKALAALQAQGIKALIYDVRQNPGGSTDALAHIVSHFTHQGPHAITIDDTGKREEENPDPNVPLLTIPWVVLCDSGSASSADITAAVAKDRGGYLIGEKSAGALGGAEVFEFADGSAMEITVVRVLGPNGEGINNVGVTPNQVVTLTPADLSASNDPQLQEAITYLQSK